MNQSYIQQRGDQIWDEIMCEIDATNNGKITFQEFEDAMYAIALPWKKKTIKYFFYHYFLKLQR